MPGNKSDNDGTAAGMMVASLIIIVGFLFGLLVFAALITSLIYAWSLVSGRTFWLWGDLYRPRDALPFFRNGVIGICLAVLFTAFICGFYDLEFPREWIRYLIAGGYSIGSYGVWSLGDNVAEPEAPASLPAARAIPPLASAPAQKPFEYASWDDERAGS